MLVAQRTHKKISNGLAVWLKITSSSFVGSHGDDYEDCCIVESDALWLDM